MNYKQIIESHKDFPIEGIEYLDLNPIYKNHKYRDELVHDCLFHSYLQILNHYKNKINI